MVMAADTDLGALAGNVLVFLAAYYTVAVAHEAMHVVAACLVGAGRSALTLSNVRSALLSRHVRVPEISGWRAEVVRHAGWLGSTLLALATTWLGAHVSMQRAAWLTALDGVCSDLLELEGPMCDHCRDMFRCGNFGVIVLDPERRKTAIEILRTMVRVTMMRGAQSGGVVTYVPSGGGSKGTTGIRSRVVNGKRTNLSTLVVDKVLSCSSCVTCRSHCLPLALVLTDHHYVNGLPMRARFGGTYAHGGLRGDEIGKSSCCVVGSRLSEVSSFQRSVRFECRAGCIHYQWPVRVVDVRVHVQVKKDQFWASITNGLAPGVRFYAGHTRFATSSIVYPQRSACICNVPACMRCAHAFMPLLLFACLLIQVN